MPPADGDCSSAYRDALEAAHRRIAQLTADAEGLPATVRRPLTSRSRRRWIAAAIVLPVAMSLGAAASAVVTTPKVTATGMVSNSGWIVQLHVPPGAKNIRYRIAPDDEVSLGDVSWMIDPTTQRAVAQTSIALPFDRLEKPTRVDVKLVDAFGIERGPIGVWIDPQHEAVASVTSMLGMIGEWVTFHTKDDRSAVVIGFAPLVAHKYALREIRWSIDAEVLDRRVLFVASNRPGVDPRDQIAVEVACAPRLVFVEVVFLDGTRTSIHRFASGISGRQCQDVDPPPPRL